MLKSLTVGGGWWMSLLLAATPQMKRISPGRDVPASSTNPLSMALQERGKSTETPVLSASLDKRSESTTSFESTTSSSSTDSNTLPFANENVGTIKQRAAAIKPSIVQTFEMGDGQRNIDLNSSVFDPSSSSSSVRGNSSVSSAAGSSVNCSSDVSRTKPTCANTGSCVVEQASASTNNGSPGHRRTDSAGSGGAVGAANKVTNPLVKPGVPQNPNPQSAVSRLNVTAPAPASLAQLSQYNHSEGPHRPPMPGKKPTHMPIPPQPLQQRHHQQPQSPPQLRQQSHHQQQQRPSSSSQQQQAAAPETKTAAPTEVLDTEDSARQSSNVLSDIDDMLQGLTDELDAMLLEEGAS